MPKPIKLHKLIFLIMLCMFIAACSSEDNPPPPTLMPSLPPSLNLTAQSGNTTISLQWNAIPDAVGYQIFRDGGDSALNSSQLTETTYQDIGLTNNRQYSYTVIAIAADGAMLMQSEPIDIVPEAE